jgi:hypothetical protein
MTHQNLHLAYSVVLLYNPKELMWQPKKGLKVYSFVTPRETSIDFFINFWCASLRQVLQLQHKQATHTGIYLGAGAGGGMFEHYTRFKRDYQKLGITALSNQRAEQVFVRGPRSFNNRCLTGSRGPWLLLVGTS